MVNIKRITVSLVLLLTAVFAVRAQMPNMTVPVDTAFRIGKLPNGLTYIIRHNNWPEHRANFYIAQKVGSLGDIFSDRRICFIHRPFARNKSHHTAGS